MAERYNNSLKSDEWAAEWKVLPCSWDYRGFICKEKLHEESQNARGREINYTNHVRHKNINSSIRENIAN